MLIDGNKELRIRFKGLCINDKRLGYEFTYENGYNTFIEEVNNGFQDEETKDRFLDCIITSLYFGDEKIKVNPFKTIRDLYDSLIQ